MSWRIKRQLFIIFLLLLILGTIGGIYYYLKIMVPISCFDNKQNQGELGVDCGGPCNAFCEKEIADLKVDWVRPFKVSTGKYDIAAMIINKNNYFGIPNFKYRLSLFDSRGVHVFEKEGEIFINPNEKALLFISGIDTGERDATKAIIEYEENKMLQGWERISDVGTKPTLSVGNEKITDSTRPTLSAEITNSSPYDISNINVSAIIYDENDNAMAVSSTFVSTLLKDSTQTVVFTWPEPFRNNWKRADVLPRIDNISNRK